MYPGLSDPHVQITRWNHQRLLAECERQRAIANLPRGSATRASSLIAVRQRIGVMMVEAGRRLTGVPAVAGEASAS